MKIVTYDVESNGLLGEWEDGVADKIYCAVVKQLNGELVPCYDKEEFNTCINDADVLICHNQICYDLPLLLKLGWIDSYTIEPDTLNGHHVTFIDTLVLSRLLNPQRSSHGLAQWGDRLGIEKPVIEDWENLSLDDYVYRCQEDVKINEAVYKCLKDAAAGWDWKEASRLEKAFQDCVHRSEMYGMWFNKAKGEELLDELNEKMETIEAEVNASLPERNMPVSQVKNPPKVRFKKNGEPSAHAIRYFGDTLVSTGVYHMVYHPNGTVYHLGDPDIPPMSSTCVMTIHNQIDLKQYLLDLGWRPEFYNFDSDGNRKSPRFNDAQTKDICPNLLKLSKDIPWVEKLTEWLMLRHRRNLLKGNGNAGLLNHRRLEVDGRLPAGMLTIGAATHRVTHRVVANLPRVSTPYGAEIRRLFGSPEGRVIVGFDASSLEDRLKGHYTYKYDGGEYARKINDPEYDAHTESAELWGISRSDAKTGNYALQFGAGIPRFSKGLGVDKFTGKHYYNLWWDNNPGLRDFKAAAEDYWKRNGETFVMGLDKRKIPCDTQHKVVNRIIQSAGAIVMKMATVIFDRLLKKEGLGHVRMTEFYHDELVVECDPSYADKVLQLGIQSIRMAGKKFKLNVDLDADGATGDTWADVH